MIVDVDAARILLKTANSFSVENNPVHELKPNWQLQELGVGLDRCGLLFTVFHNYDNCLRIERSGSGQIRFLDCSSTVFYDMGLILSALSYFSYSFL